MPLVRFNFLNWRPDQDEFNTDGLQVATNVYHDVDGYKEMRGPNTTAGIATAATVSNFISIDPLGGIANSIENGDFVVIRDLAPNVEIGTFGVFERVYTAPGTTTTASLQSFASAELKNRIVTTAKFFFNSGSPTSTTTASGYVSYNTGYGQSSTWTDLPNSALGAVCGVINQFAFVGNDGTGPSGNRTVRWCAIGDATDWPTPNTATARAVQAGSQELNGQFGDVKAIAGGDFFGYIFQESAITKATYVGGDVVFTFDTFEEERGCPWFNRIIAVDDTIFFESRTGRHTLANDQITDIGLGRVDVTSFPSLVDGERLYKNTASHLIFFTQNLIYNYKTDQWTSYTTVDPSFSVDTSDKIIGQALNVSTNTVLVSSTGAGANLDATITTGDVELNGDKRSFIRGVRPLIDGGTWTVRVGARDTLTASINWSTSTALTTSTQMADFREEARYNRFEFSNSDGFGTALGSDIDHEPTGEI